ncbi:MAG: hypothetical protein UW71_C0012G0002 [Parcubacteria group bacterium GW2011_GWB1_44_7]|nr:MAG: hypothetical protein UW71_C0012G0002 [Parcubacteria group bacterium GW2011_GWB1_44_7]
MKHFMKNMGNKRFQRKIEDFVCEKCKTEIKGNGWTNHCPKCLWSKHVDVNPGDREEKCGGLMAPIGILKKGDNYIINHQCQVCGFERQKKLEKTDNFDTLVGLI